MVRRCTACDHNLFGFYASSSHSISSLGRTSWTIPSLLHGSFKPKGAFTVLRHSLQANQSCQSHTLLRRLAAQVQVQAQALHQIKLPPTIQLTPRGASRSTSFRILAYRAQFICARTSTAAEQLNPVATAMPTTAAISTADPAQIPSNSQFKTHLTHRPENSVPSAFWF